MAIPNGFRLTDGANMNTSTSQMSGRTGVAYTGPIQRTVALDEQTDNPLGWDPVLDAALEWLWSQHECAPQRKQLGDSLLQREGGGELIRRHLGKRHALAAVLSTARHGSNEEQPPSTFPNASCLQSDPIDLASTIVEPCEKEVLAIR